SKMPEVHPDKDVPTSFLNKYPMKNDEEVLPRDAIKLDDDMAVAMRKMKRSFELNRRLPQVDCRICGYQSCQALTDAVVNNKADIRQCIFVQRILEQTDKMTTSEAIRIERNIWGDQKLDKDSLKGLDITP
ncbi:MAG: hypothetical protein J6Y34_07750, partial [Bacteroidales bacterium]|nr:hypothetical protein [Bacteroidales bacterium]